MFLVSFGKSGDLFFVKAKHYKSVLSYAHSKRKLLAPSDKGKWISSIDYFRAEDNDCGYKSK